ncbi:MAG: A/G-specific adenine glycosylase [Bacteroidetes bacterium]|nr:A/G-specific adenine glycosylase [Bacteroidota bacterium]
MKQFQTSLVRWYEEKKRKLPWRETKDPYLIWLSEIILQQTRVDQGLNYYLKFKATFPSIQDLAKADEMEVLNLWKGLGYYSRARNLHATAKLIMDNYHGQFPSSYEEIIKLKGIGSYTAAAISSFAYGEAKAVLDGNVFRVLSRIFNLNTPIDSALGKKEFQELANELLDIENPAQHNQAIMEFGAIQCVPLNPKCHQCPLDFMCEAKAKNSVKQLPVKMGKTKITNKYFVFQIFKNEGKVLLERRTNSGIWKNMFQFPLIEFKDANEKRAFIKNYKYEYVSSEVKHVLSHQHLYCHFIFIEGFKKSNFTQQFWVSKEEISNYPVPRVIEKYIEENSELIFNHH